MNRRKARERAKQRYAQKFQWFHPPRWLQRLYFSEVFDPNAFGETITVIQPKREDQRVH